MKCHCDVIQESIDGLRIVDKKGPTEGYKLLLLYNVNLYHSLARSPAAAPEYGP